MSLQIKQINEPQEFLNCIKKDQNTYLYVYIENIFEPIDNIYDIILSTYDQYKCGLMFTDIQITHNDHTSNQYFHDIKNGNEKKVIYSPLIAKYTPIELKIHPNIKYHSFSFLQQSMKFILPWHVPVVGFKTTLYGDQFKDISKDASWVMQHVT